jgi:hypothetical protein
LSVGKLSVGKLSVCKLNVSKLSVGKLSISKLSFGKLSVSNLSVSKLSVGKLSVSKLSVGKLSVIVPFLCTGVKHIPILYVMLSTIKMYSKFSSHQKRLDRRTNTDRHYKNFFAVIYNLEE